jgi:predicted dehydrogenase
MSHDAGTTRRRFLGASAAAAALSIVPREVLGGPGNVPPSDRVRIGYVGCGTQGIRQLIEALPRKDVKIAAICDPNRATADYPEWGKNEIRDKVRAFLGDPTYGEGIDGCRCGREVVREIVDRHYARAGETGKVAAYADFRELLEAEKDLDAIYNMTPDHLHGTVAIAAMRKGKHAVTHKPVANYLNEVRLVVKTAEEKKAATHLFCASNQQATPRIAEWIAAGAIGDVREVHNWSTRPFWPQGMTELPRETPTVPDGMDWDLWLGPVPHRPYHPAYTHAVFRGWFEFGTGALGDMGHYSLYQVFRILKLGSPSTVEASRDQFWKIEGSTWSKQANFITYPRASMIRWEFPARDGMGPVAVHWYDGGFRPPLFPELEKDGKEMPDEGLLFVGEKGKILAGFTGDDPRLIPEEKMRAFAKPPETLPRPIGELDQWLRACRGGPPSDASFPAVYPLSETVCLGTIALRVGKKLRWDPAKAEFTNSPEANAFLRRPAYRPGWEL